MWSGAILAILLALVARFYFAPTSSKKLGEIVRETDKMGLIIAEGESLQILEEGFEWAEGPVWVPSSSLNDESGGYLLFSDVKANILYKWSEQNGLEEFLDPSGLLGADRNSTHPLLEPGSNGVVVDPVSGNLVICDHGNRRIYMVGREGGVRVEVVSHYRGMRFNSPNDMVFSPEGDLYFTDPSYGLQRKGAPGVMETSLERELGVNGVYRLPAKHIAAAAAAVSASETGAAAATAAAAVAVELVVSSMYRPNGIGLSPDGARLLVACSCAHDPHWKVYDVEKGEKAEERQGGGVEGDDVVGSLEPGVRFEPASSLAASLRMTPRPDGSQLEGNPDGLKVDHLGNIFATGPGGVLVFQQLGAENQVAAPAKGGWTDSSPSHVYVGSIRTFQKTGNVALGRGRDGASYLYVTADSYLARVRLYSSSGVQEEGGKR